MSLIEGSDKSGTPPDNSGGDGKPPVQQQSDWIAALPPDLKNVVDTKGYKTPADVLTAYVNAEKLIGVDKIPVPKDGVWDQAARLKLGIPDGPEKYTFTKPELPEGMQWDANFEKTALAAAHQMGLTPAQVQSLMNLYAGQRAAEFGGKDAAIEAAQAETAGILKKEWGNAYQVKLDNAARAARMVGGDDLIEALVETGAGNNPSIIRAFAKIGAMLGEDKMKSGLPSGFGLTPEEARTEANRLMASPAYTDRNHLENREVVAKVEALFRQAYPEAS